jgi:hypothetical protein
LLAVGVLRFGDSWTRTGHVLEKLLPLTGLAKKPQAPQIVTRLGGFSSLSTGHPIRARGATMPRGDGRRVPVVVMIETLAPNA